MSRVRVALLQHVHRWQPLDDVIEFLGRYTTPDSFQFSRYGKQRRPGLLIDDRKYFIARCATFARRRQMRIRSRIREIRLRGGSLARLSADSPARIQLPRLRAERPLGVTRRVVNPPALHARLVSLLPPVLRYILFPVFPRRIVHRAESRPIPRSVHPSHLIRDHPCLRGFRLQRASNGLSLHSALRHLPSRVIGSNGRARAKHKNNNVSDIYRTY